MVLPRSKRVLAGMSLLLSMVGLVAVVMASRSPQNIFSKAWSGVTANVELLQSRLGLTPSPVASLPTQAKSKDVYDRLVKAYPRAEIQDVDLPAIDIRGRAYLHYAPLIDKTYVFSRIENLPLLEGKFVRLWLTDNQSYLPVGISEFVQENNRAVAYSVFVKPGDVRANYKELVLSYESSTQTAVPTTGFLNLKF